jgi:hypothetical protein
MYEAQPTCWHPWLFETSMYEAQRICWHPCLFETSMYEAQRICWHPWLFETSRYVRSPTYLLASMDFRDFYVRSPTYLLASMAFRDFQPICCHPWLFETSNLFAGIRGFSRLLRSPNLKKKKRFWSMFMYYRRSFTTHKRTACNEIHLTVRSAKGKLLPFSREKNK